MTFTVTIEQDEMEDGMYNLYIDEGEQGGGLDYTLPTMEDVVEKLKKYVSDLELKVLGGMEESKKPTKNSLFERILKEASK